MVGVYPNRNTKEYQNLYQTVATIYSCVGTIAQQIAQLPVRVYEMKGEEKVDITESPDFDIFRTYNDYQTHFEFWENSIGNLELTGECFWLMDYKAGKISNMFPLNSDVLKVIPHNKFVVSHYVFMKGGKDLVIPKENVFFFKYFNPKDHIRGLSPIAAATNDIILERDAVDSSKSQFKQGARPSGVLTTEAEMDDPTWQRTVDYVKEQHEGTANLNKIMFLSHGVKWQQMGMSPQDMEFMSLRKWTKKTIMEIYRVPPIYIMQFDEASKLANADVQLRLFWEMMRPKLQKLTNIFNARLMPLITNNQNARMEFDTSEVSALKPDTEKTIKQWESGIRNGAATPNEFRETVLGLDRADEPAMDAHYIASSIMPITESVQEPIEPEETGKFKQLGQRIDQLKPVKDLKTQLKDGLANILRINKQANLTAEEIKAFAGQNKIERKFIREFVPVIKKLFKGQEKEILDNLRAEKMWQKFDTGVNFDFQKWVQEFEEAGEPFISDAIAAAGAELAAQYGTSFTPIHPETIAAVGGRVEQYAKIVNQTTKTQIDNLIKQGIQDDLSIGAMSNSVSQYFAQTGVYRAERIARTEAVGASNLGRTEAMKQSPRIKEHMWISQRDSDVRDGHTRLDGTKVKVGDPFPVGGDYNGDPTYPSDINERCGTIPVKVDKDPMKGKTKAEARDSWENAGFSEEDALRNVDALNHLFGRNMSWNQFKRTYIGDDLMGAVDGDTFKAICTNNQIFIQGKNGAKTIFEFRYDFGISRGKKYAHMDLALIDDSFANKGVFKGLFRNQVELYERAGYSSIELTANIDVGGYAWAKYGFDNVGNRVEFYRSFGRMAKHNEPNSFFGGLTKADMDDWIESMSDIPVYEFAKMGTVRGVSIKDNMLGTYWGGRLDLKGTGMDIFRAYTTGP